MHSLESENDSDKDAEDHLEDEGATQRAPPDDEKRLNRRAPAARDLLQKVKISYFKLMALYIYSCSEKSHLKIAMDHQSIKILIHEGLQEYFHITRGS